MRIPLLAPVMRLLDALRGLASAKHRRKRAVGMQELATRDAARAKAEKRKSRRKRAF